MSTGSNGQAATNEAGRRKLLMRLAAVAAGGAWSALGYGLLFSPSDQQGWGEVEAGGRAAASFFVYLPFLALTVAVLAGVVYGLVAISDFSAHIVMLVVLVAAFTVWVMNQNYLHDPKPHLATWATTSLLLDVGGVAFLVAAQTNHAKPGRH